MIHFGNISKQKFLQEYWQKKPLLINQALQEFISPLTPNEIAGLACEEDFESRIVTGCTENNNWQLSNGPFPETHFATLPETNWTLLVQGVDRYIVETYHLINHFDFIPRWRFDDVMISYAAKGGSVGPHFDFYDVFLLQGSGKRRWHLSAKNCTLDNYLGDTPLRIMKQFEADTIIEAEPGDVLYVPPKIAHHGVSLDDECMTYSIGYRSYSMKEMLEYLEQDENKSKNQFYQDPSWQDNQTPALIPDDAIVATQDFLQLKKLPQDYFGCFVTKLDPMDEKLLNEFSAYSSEEILEIGASYELHPSCRIGYCNTSKGLHIYINGEPFDFGNFDDEMLIDFCNTRKINISEHNTFNHGLAIFLLESCVIRRLRS